MQGARLLAVATVASSAWSIRGEGNPIATVLQLVDQLITKIDGDKDKQAKVFAEYQDWCESSAKDSEFAKNAAAKQKAKLEAEIGELGSDIEVADSKIEELVSKIANAESELKKATAIREKEQSDFTASESELVEAVDALSRATGVMEKELAANPSAFAQVAATSVAGVLQGLGAVLDAASLSSSDKKVLQSYVQSQQSSEDSDEDDMAQPAAAAYKSKGGGIVDVLQDMKEKAEGQLGQLRQAEVKSRHDFEMLKGSLTQKAKDNTAEKKDQEEAMSAANEGKASAEGDLDVTTKELEGSTKKMEGVQASCLKIAGDHEATLVSQKEELTVLAKAKQLIVESTSDPASFLQVSSSSAVSAMGMGSKLVAAVKQLARRQHSSALAQLASRINAMLRHGGRGDPFVKVRNLIKDMIAKLERQGQAEQTEKAYCDEQMAKTEAKNSDLGDDIEKMTSRFDQGSSKSAGLKQEVQELENHLASLATEQAELDKVRTEMHSEFMAAKADDEQALTGVRKALGVLSDYYGSSDSALIQDDSNFNAFMQQPAPPETYSKSTGAGGSIISILEVCESDIATGLAKATAEEDDAQSEYEKVSQENAITKTTAEQDVKFKSQEIKSLKTTLAELTSDRETANTELSAVGEYYGELKARCVAKPESYEKLKERRAAEIQGLKEALAILDDETALVQRRHRGSFRGSLSVE